MMKWFGPPTARAPDSELEREETPVGTLCRWCDEWISTEDAGFTMPYLSSTEPARRIGYHQECLLRRTIGSIAHQQRRCICFGGSLSEHDPPELSKREAARQAMAYSRRSMHQK